MRFTESCCYSCCCSSSYHCRRCGCGYRWLERAVRWLSSCCSFFLHRYFRCRCRYHWRGQAVMPSREQIFTLAVCRALWLSMTSISCLLRTATSWRHVYSVTRKQVTRRVVISLMHLDVIHDVITRCLFRNVMTSFITLLRDSQTVVSWRHPWRHDATEWLHNAIHDVRRKTSNDSTFSLQFASARWRLMHSTVVHKNSSSSYSNYASPCSKARIWIGGGGGTK